MYWYNAILYCIMPVPVTTCVLGSTIWNLIDELPQFKTKMLLQGSEEILLQGLNEVERVLDWQKLVKNFEAINLILVDFILTKWSDIRNKIFFKFKKFQKFSIFIFLTFEQVILSDSVGLYWFCQKTWLWTNQVLQILLFGMH